MEGIPEHWLGVWHPLPAGLRESDRLPEPIFTPATKAESGHDENISFDQMVEPAGKTWAKSCATSVSTCTRRRPISPKLAGSSWLTRSSSLVDRKGDGTG